MMRDWLPHQGAFQQEILSSDGPGLHTSCANCQKSSGTAYRCTDCYFSGILCQDCCIADHRRHPFHSITQWNGRYFEPTTLQAIGFVLHVGHEGSPCPHWSVDHNGKGEFTVVDVNRIHVHKVSWCRCLNAPDRWRQLLRMNLYPATVHSPRTAFTFRLLRYYDMDSLECNTTASSFMTKLRRLTDLYHPLTVPVSVIAAIRHWGVFTIG
jgi:hypothetical protein